jgi:hypothetical protein
MLAIALDDIVPVVVVAGTVIAVWLYNVATGSRPGRRGRRPPASAPRRDPANDAR